MLQRLRTSSLFLMLLLAVTLFASGVAVAQQNDPGNNPPVLPPNQAPETIGTIPGFTLTVGGVSDTVNLGRHFSDPEDELLTYTAASSNTTIATASISPTNVLTVTAKAVGTVEITVTAIDPGGLTAEQQFSVTVNSANAAPIPVGTIPNQTVKLGGTALTIEVDKSFQDTDEDVLTFTATSLDTAKATVSVSTSVVTITPVAEGLTRITVTATDPGNLSAKQQFSVTVKPRNRAPVAKGTIPDNTAMVGGSGDQRNLSLYFSDPDADTLTYAAASSDTTKATVRVVDETDEITMLYVTPVAAGTATITVTAADSEGASATQSYTLTVIPENTGPSPAPNISKLPDQIIKVGGTATVDLSSYFTDADGDTLTYTASSADESKATVSVSSATLTITAVAEGTTTITARATDPGEAWAKLDGSVTVRVTNSAPTSISIPDQTMNANQTATINLASYFSDADGDALTYAASSSDTGKATTSLSGTTLTVNTLAAGTATISATATDPFSLSASLSFTLTINAAPSQADVVPGLSAQEQLLPRTLAHV